MFCLLYEFYCRISQVRSLNLWSLNTRKRPALAMNKDFNPLKAELNPIRHLLALAGAHHFVDVSRIRVN
jgi:hypothetical protein